MLPPDGGLPGYARRTRFWPATPQVFLRLSWRRPAVAGVFEVLDLAGQDLALAVAAALLPDLESSVEVPSGRRQKVGRGELGVKAGRGFYPRTPETAAARSGAIAQALLQMAQLSDPPTPSRRR